MATNPVCFVYEDSLGVKGAVAGMGRGKKVNLSTYAPPKCDADVYYIVNSMSSIGVWVDELYLHPDDYAIYKQSFGGTYSCSVSYALTSPSGLSTTHSVFGERVHPDPVTESKSCECGSAKCGSPNHSSWCPMHSP